MGAVKEKIYGFVEIVRALLYMNGLELEELDDYILDNVVDSYEDYEFYLKHKDRILELIDENEDEDDEDYDDWVDPAGGTHSGDEDDPAHMYESTYKLNEKLVNGSVKERSIDLKGPEGNAFVILGIAHKFCKQLSEYDPNTYNWKKIESEMTSGDYKNLVHTFENYFGDYITIYGADVLEESARYNIPYQGFGEAPDESNDNIKFEIGDIVGNTVQGFNFEVIGDVDKTYIRVKDILTGREFSTFRENMYRRENKRYNKFDESVNEGRRDVSQSHPLDDLKANFRSWEQDCDNRNDTEELYSILQDRHPDFMHKDLWDYAADWTGFNGNDEDDDDLDEGCNCGGKRPRPKIKSKNIIGRPKLHESEDIKMPSLLNETDINWRIQKDRDIDKNPRYVGGYNKFIDPKKIIQADRPEYDYKERKEAIKHISKKHKLLKDMGYDLDTDEEDPTKAPTKRELTKAMRSDKPNKFKNLRTSQLSNIKDKFNTLKGEYNKEDIMMDRLYKKHDKSAGSFE